MLKGPVPLQRRPQYPFRFQSSLNDCGPSCAASIAEYYHLDVDLQQLRERLLGPDGQGTTVASFTALEDIFEVELGKLVDISTLPAVTPLIAYLPNERHYVVLWEWNKKAAIIGDPSGGIQVIDQAGFRERWTGIAIILRPRNSATVKTKAARSHVRIVSDLFAAHKNEGMVLAVLTSLLGLLHTIFAIVFPRYLTALHSLLIITLIYTVLSFGLVAMLSWGTAVTRKRMSLSLGNRIYSAMPTLPKSLYTPGDVYTRFSDGQTVAEILLQLIKDVPYTAVIGLGAFVYLLSLNWVWGLSLFAGGVLIAWRLFPFVKKARTYVYQNRLKASSLNNQIREWWFSGELPAIDTYNEVINSLFLQAMWSIPVSIVVGLSSSFGLLAVIFLFIIDKRFPGVAPILSAITVTNYFAFAAYSLYDKVTRWQMAQPSIQRLGEMVSGK